VVAAGSLVLPGAWVAPGAAEHRSLVAFRLCCQRVSPVTFQSRTMRLTNLCRFFRWKEPDITHSVPALAHLVQEPEPSCGNSHRSWNNRIRSCSPVLEQQSAVVAYLLLAAFSTCSHPSSSRLRRHCSSRARERAHGVALLDACACLLLRTTSSIAAGHAELMISNSSSRKPSNSKVPHSKEQRNTVRHVDRIDMRQEGVSLL
jgi:hypothetical protein